MKPSLGRIVLVSLGPRGAPYVPAIVTRVPYDYDGEQRVDVTYFPPDASPLHSQGIPFGERGWIWPPRQQDPIAEQDG